LLWVHVEASPATAQLINGLFGEYIYSQTLVDINILMVRAYVNVRDVTRVSTELFGGQSRRRRARLVVDVCVSDDTGCWYACGGGVCVRALV
jgi:hypothetical protein